MALQSGEPGPFAQAAAGLEMAAWDLCARRAGLPLHVLLGPGRGPVPVYASALTAEALPQLVSPRLAAGWRGFKLKVGFGARVDADALAALREMAGPEAALMLPHPPLAPTPPSTPQPRPEKRVNPIHAARQARFQEIRGTAWRVVADPERLEALAERVPVLGAAIAQARRFCRIVREREAGDLDDWLDAARAGPLRGFAAGIARDLAAVRAGLSEPWSTGPVEGQISRLKTIKRRMGGRAKADLLRQRILHAA